MYMTCRRAFVRALSAWIPSVVFEAWNSRPGLERDDDDASTVL